MNLKLRRQLRQRLLGRAFQYSHWYENWGALQPGLQLQE
jgi:hypothetical protein